MSRGQRVGRVPRQQIDLAGLQGGQPHLRVQRHIADFRGVAENRRRDRPANIDVNSSNKSLHNTPGLNYANRAAQAHHCAAARSKLALTPTAAVAPANRIVPRPRGTIPRTASHRPKTRRPRLPATLSRSRRKSFRESGAGRHLSKRGKAACATTWQGRRHDFTAAHVPDHRRIQGHRPGTVGAPCRSRSPGRRPCPGSRSRIPRRARLCRPRRSCSDDRRGGRGSGSPASPAWSTTSGWCGRSRRGRLSWTIYGLCST